LMLMPFPGSHTNCFQFNENFNRKALWLPKIVAIVDVARSRAPRLVS